MEGGCRASPCFVSAHHELNPKLTFTTEANPIQATPEAHPKRKVHLPVPTLDHFADGPVAL